MKSIILTFFTLFFFSTLTGQETASLISTTTKEKLTNNQNTKIAFYETLIAINDFDITIKKTKKIALKNKTEFYKALMIKNGFTIDNNINTRLADKQKKENRKENMLTNTTETITGLLP